MRRFATFISCLILGLSVSMSQSVSELFRGNVFLTSVFVNPLGIQNLPDYADAVSLENEIRASGNEYRSMNLGPFGEIFRIYPEDMMIGETPVSGMAGGVSNDSIMLLYMSESSDSYESLYATLDEALSRYAKDTEKSTIGSTRYSIYMLTERYGVAVAADDDRKISLACLLDIRNLQGFLGLDSLIGN